MFKMYIQVSRDVYYDYVSLLSAYELSWERTSDFTKVGEWCVVCITADKKTALDLAEHIYDSL